MSAASTASAEAGRVTLNVKGMTKLLDITWLDWPNRVEEALAGLPGIRSIDVDLKNDLFHLTYDQTKVAPEEMLETIREQGFQGQVISRAHPPILAGQKVRRDLTRLPEDLQNRLQEARRNSKLLLLAFHGPGWPSCARMDTVTYPDPRVTEELAKWILLKLDIAERRRVAGLFEVVAVPVAVAVTTEGDELGRIENFVAPAAFRRRLEDLRRLQAQDVSTSQGIN